MALDDENPLYSAYMQPSTDVPRAFRQGVADDFAVRPDERGYGPVYDPSTDISSRNLEAFMAAGAKDPILVPSWLKDSGGDVRGRTPFENIQLMPGTRYRLVDSTGKNDNTVLASGSTPEELFRLQQIVTNQLVPQGGQANWRLEQEAGDGWQTIGGDLYNKPITGMLADIALPAALAAIPGLNAVGAGLAAAGGSGLSSAIQGRSFEDALTRAAIAGVTAGTMKGIMPGGGNGGIGPMPDVDLAGLSNAAFGSGSAALPQAALEQMLTATASRIGGGALSGALAGTAGGALGAAAGAQNPAAQNNGSEMGGIDVTASRIGGSSISPSLPLQYLVDPGTSYPDRLAADNASDEIEVRNKRYGPRGTLSAPITLPDGTLDFGDVVPEEVSSARRADEIPPFTLNVPPFNPNTIPPQPVPPVQPPAETLADEEQVVTARRPDVVPPLSAGIAVPPLVIPPFAPPAPVSPGGAGSTADAVKAALKLLPLLGGLFGGTAPGNGRNLGNAADRLNPIFSSKLPPPSRNYTPQALAPRDMSGVNWKRYGFGPELSFFNNVPVSPEEQLARRRGMATGGAVTGALSPAAVAAVRRLVPNATDEQIHAFLQTDMGKQIADTYQSSAQQYANGGSALAAKSVPQVKESFAVRGPGTGRSDEIPALLSDGEYVIDAETVALLGDGSSKAGAERLDALRANIRKHKGQSLAKGEISANAKPPERYLSGGRVK